VAWPPARRRGYLHALRTFLVACTGPDGDLALGELGAGDITAFVVAYCPTRPRGSAKLLAVALRSLLAFLHVEGVVGGSLTSCVPSVASWRLSGLPRALTPEEVRRLVGSCEGRGAVGLRDRAALLLLVRLGLRAGEVAGLELSDIDWRGGELVVRGKGDRAERLPLPDDVGRAVACYLHEARPPCSPSRRVFLRVRAPWQGLTAGGVTMLVAGAARRAGLGTIHAHRLRHTAACELLRAGSSLKEIGQLLRHRSALTTAIYAKVDRTALRALARPWPGQER
jgi:integrase/recombinase XerD